MKIIYVCVSCFLFHFLSIYLYNPPFAILYKYFRDFLLPKYYQNIPFSSKLVARKGPPNKPKPSKSGTTNSLLCPRSGGLQIYQFLQQPTYIMLLHTLDLIQYQLLISQSHPDNALLHHKESMLRRNPNTHP